MGKKTVLLGSSFAFAFPSGEAQRSGRALEEHCHGEGEQSVARRLDEVWPLQPCQAGGGVHPHQAHQWHEGAQSYVQQGNFWT
eukprot:6474399-Amphidinium_carterae.1